MSLATTTLSGNITNTQTSFGVASASNITAPNFQTGAGITYLLVEQELMQVQSVAGTVVSVKRGMFGTAAAGHQASAPVLSGLPADFLGFVPAIRGMVTTLPTPFIGVSAPVASAATIQASGPLFHVTGTTTIATILPPSQANLPAGVGSGVPNYTDGGEITIIFDGVATWNATGNIAVAGSPTTAGSSVTFIFDQNSGKWHPSRLA